MIDYAVIRDAADAAIAEAGQSGYLRRTGAGAGTDPWNPGSATPVDYSIVFVLVDYSMRDRDGTTIQQNDQQAIIRAGKLEIEASDIDQLVDKNGKVWEVVNLRPLAPGGLTLLYTAQVRR